MPDIGNSKRRWQKPSRSFIVAEELRLSRTRDADNASHRSSRSTPLNCSTRYAPTYPSTASRSIILPILLNLLNLAYAQKHDLLISAGSDSHGPPGRMPIKYRAELCRHLLERGGNQMELLRIFKGFARKYLAFAQSFAEKEESCHVSRTHPNNPHWSHYDSTGTILR